MATTVKSILNRASALLNDEEHVRWDEAELLEWLNDGQRVIAKGPATDAYVLRNTITCATGTVQSLPSDANRLVDVIKNVSDGSNIHQSDYATVDMLKPAWRAEEVGPAEVYFYDGNNPLEFEVYPPQAGGETIEVVYNAAPGDAEISGNVVINDLYADSLIDYIVYRALSKDTEDSALDLNRATAFYRAFLVSIGYKETVDGEVEPRRS